MKLDHFYITVTDLNKAILFYENILQQKITHREGDRWADFSKDDNSIYFGIYNITIDKEDFSTGSSPTLCLKSKDIKEDFLRIKSLKPKSITSIIKIQQPAKYEFFQFEDNWGNNWEVAEYNYSI